MVNSHGLGENFRWAFGWARLFAGVFSAWALVLSIARGSLKWPEYQTTTWGIIAGYWLAAVVGSFVVGLLRPLSRSSLGAFLVGWVGGTIVYGSVVVPTGMMKEAPIWIYLIPGCLVGGGLAVVWHDKAEYGPNVHTNWRFIAIIVGVAAILALAMKAAGWW
jgi:hypothetical protein